MTETIKSAGLSFAGNRDRKLQPLRTQSLTDPIKPAAFFYFFWRFHEPILSIRGQA